MGIRFRCPQGHKLNVKSFLAGKKGICPHCGAKLLIPYESDPSLLEERAQKKALERAAREGLSQAKLQQPSASSGGLGPLAGNKLFAGASAASPKPVAPASAAGAAAAALSPLGIAPVGQAPAAGAQVRNGGPDPISEAPQAIWYVRPPSGGQYGPAAGDVMRQWINEGRVSSDSLVWREGWPDWREAGVLFPDLPSALPQTAPTVTQPRFH